MSPKEIHKSLRELDSLESLRAFLTELGYEYEDQPVSTRGWKEDITKNVVDLKKIAGYAGFSVIYCKTAYENDGDIKLDKKLSTLERKVYHKLPETLKLCMMVFCNKDETHWHFVNAKPQDSRVLLRRYIIGAEEKIRTASERLAMIEVEGEPKTDQLNEQHEQAFNVEKITEDFFDDYKEEFDYIFSVLQDQREVNDVQEMRDYAQQLLSRFMFLYFLQRKGWLGNKINFLKTYWGDYRQNKKADNFYEDYLDPLFFVALNEPTSEKPAFKKEFPENFKKELMDAPYLNGGLFESNSLDSYGFRVPDRVFERLFGTDLDPGLLEHYNFTIREDAPFDKEIAVDPEMLGIVFESLVNAEERGELGIFYTPRTEVDFMCRRSLLQYLLNHSQAIKDKRKLYQFLFQEKEEEVKVNFSKVEQNELLELLRQVTVLDPAVGSGSFLVGMMQVLLELFGKLYQSKGLEKNTFQLKKNVIEETLYGVDIKKWAVQVAELRLWLQLVVDAGDEILSTARQDPLLPSLAFKLRDGDSLVQKVGDIPFGVKEEGIQITGILKRKLNDLERKKREFYEGKTKITEKKIKTQEVRFYREVLNKKIKRLEKERKEIDKQMQKDFGKQLELIKEGKQDELEFDEDKEKLKKKRDKKTEQIQALKKQKRPLYEKKPFIWRIGFSEIFYQKGGFDIVIANPPYVRQEKIADPTIQNPSSEDKKKYKKDLLAALQLDWGKNLDLSKRSDLYVYFYLRGLALLNPKGAFCYVSSNSWLDVGYGKNLQEFLLKNTRIKGIYDNQVKRSFKSADVNTIIAVLTLAQDQTAALQNTARFVMFKKPFEEVINSDNLWDIQQKKEKTYKQDYKVFPITQAEIYKRGADGQKKKKANQEQLLTKDIDKLDYNGDKWGGKYLRAPEIYWKILEKAGDKLVRLGDIADVRRGFTTGANEFFFVKDITDILDSSEFSQVVGSNEIQWVEFKKSNSLRIIFSLGKKFIIENNFLEPTAKSPRENKSPILDKNVFSKSLIMCHRENVSDKFISNYIEAGEKQGYNSRPTCSSRSLWYDLGRMQPADFLWMESINEINRVYINKAAYLESDKFYGISTKKQLPLNSTIVGLFREVSGFASLGQGVLKLAVYEVKNLPVPNLNLDKHLNNRKVNSIFEELGFDKNKCIRDQTPDPLPDREALDDVVFDALGLTKQERKEVYWAVAELVKNRFKKAKSV